MRTSKHHSRGKLFGSISLAVGLIVLLLISLKMYTLSAVAAVNNNASSIDYDDSWPSSLHSTGVLTNHIYLPTVIRDCFHQSIREPLADTGDFSGTIKITAPEHCTTGYSPGKGIQVVGTYTGVSSNTMLWVFAYAEDFLYYPQSSNACAGEPPFQQGGIWHVSAFLGLAGGEPEWFDIVVVLADDEASQFLSDKLINDCMTGNYTGMPAAQLEQFNLSEKNFISVQTTD